MLSCVALAWHLAGSSTPFGVTIATMLPCIKAFKLILSIFPAPFFLDILIPTLVSTPHPFLHPLLPRFCPHLPQVYSSLSGLVLLQGLSWPCSGLVHPAGSFFWTRAIAQTGKIYLLLAGTQGVILAEGAIALSVTLSGGALFAS